LRRGHTFKSIEDLHRFCAVKVFSFVAAVLIFARAAVSETLEGSREK